MAERKVFYIGRYDGYKAKIALTHEEIAKILKRETSQIEKELKTLKGAQALLEVLRKEIDGNICIFSKTTTKGRIVKRINNIFNDTIISIIEFPNGKYVAGCEQNEDNWMVFRKKNATSEFNTIEECEKYINTCIQKQEENPNIWIDLL